MSFIEGRTKIEDLQMKESQIKERAVSIVIETLNASSMKKRGLIQASIDIKNLLEGFSEHDQVEILRRVVCMQIINNYDYQKTTTNGSGNGLFSGRSRG